MNLLNYIVLVYLIIQITNGTLTKYLLNQHISGSVVLLFRAAICLLLILLIAIIKKQSLIPKKPKIQGMRIILSGIGLLLITNSYAYLNATSVAFVSRLDMLLVIMVTCYIAGNLLSLKNIITSITFLVGLAFISFFKNATESLQGIFMALGGTFCIVAGYFLIKSVVEKENELVITGIACIGSILMSGMDIIVNSIQILPLNNVIWFAFTVEGCCMFLLYILTVRLYKLISLENAQFIALIGTVLTIPFEYLFAGSNFEWSYIVGMLLMVGIVSITLFYFGHKQGT